MTWSFVAAGTAQGGSAPTVPLPAGWQQNDLLVLAGTGGQSAYSAPAGWSTGVASASAPRQALFYKFAGASESSVAVTGGGAAGQMVMLAWRNVNTLDVNGTIKLTNSTTASTNSLTTTIDNDLVISIFSEDATGTTPGSVTGTTIRYADNTVGRSLVVVDETLASHGATTSRSCVFGSSANNAGFSISFSPAASAALTGQASTGSAGTITPATSTALTGVAGTAAVGTLSPLIAYSAVLTGVVSTANSGALSPVTTVALTGVQATGAVGSMVGMTDFVPSRMLMLFG